MDGRNISVYKQTQPSLELMDTQSTKVNEETQSSLELLGLPIEILLNVFSFINPINEKVVVRQVCKETRSIIDNLSLQSPTQLISHLFSLPIEKMYGFTEYCRSLPVYKSIHGKMLQNPSELSNAEVLFYTLTTDDVKTINFDCLSKAIEESIASAQPLVDKINSEHDKRPEDRIVYNALVAELNSKYAPVLGAMVTFEYLKNIIQNPMNGNLFGNCILEIKRLCNSHLKRACNLTFAYANLSGACFYGLNFNLTDFTNINLQGAKFASTFDGEMKNSQLSKNKFYNANLTDVVFSGTFLNQTDLSGAIFNNTKFKKAVFFHVKWMNGATPENISQRLTDIKNILTTDNFTSEKIATLKMDITHEIVALAENTAFDFGSALLDKALAHPVFNQPSIVATIGAFFSVNKAGISVKSPEWEILDRAKNMLVLRNKKNMGSILDNRC